MTCKQLHRKLRCIPLLAVLLCCLGYSASAETGQGQDTVGTLPLVLYAEGDTSSYTGQLSLGSAVADGAILVTGADVALIPQEDLLRNLLAGEVTGEELALSVADQALVTVEISPKQLKDFLETGLSHLTLEEQTKQIDYEASAFDGFPQVGGLRYQGDLSAPAGERITRVMLDDGTELALTDEDGQLVLVTTAAVLSGGYGYPALEGTSTGTTEQEALAALIRADVLDSAYDGSGRLQLIGHTGDSLAGRYPLGLLAVLAILVVLLTSRSGSRFLELLRSRWSGEP